MIRWWWLFSKEYISAKAVADRQRSTATTTGVVIRGEFMRYGRKCVDHYYFTDCLPLLWTKITGISNVAKNW
jgi:hypothetical protein